MSIGTAVARETRMTAISEAIASANDARKRCEETGNSLWAERWEERLRYLEACHLPSGSGVDSGTKIDRERTTTERIVLHTEFHHMDEYGGYDGWTSHTITVVPSLVGGFYLRISGRNRNQIKDSLYDLFDATLRGEVDLNSPEFNPWM